MSHPRMVIRALETTQDLLEEKLGDFHTASLVQIYELQLLIARDTTTPVYYDAACTWLELYQQRRRLGRYYTKEQT